MTDTPEEIKKQMRLMLKQKSPYERLKMASSMFNSAKRLVISGIMKENPTINEKDLKTKLLQRFYSKDLTEETLIKISKTF